YGMAVGVGGIEYARKGERDRAIADFSEAIRLDPKYANAFVNRGIAYAKKSEYDRAIADYSEAIRLDPQNASAFWNRGRANRAKGEGTGGREELDQTTQLRPKSCHQNAPSINTDDHKHGRRH